MLRQLLTSTIRNLKRNLLYAVIVIGGLSLGITTFLAIIQWTVWQGSFDKHFPENQHIYRISLEERRENFERHTARIIHGDVVHQLYTDNQLTGSAIIARIAPFRNAIIRKNEIVFYENQTFSCDPEFLEIFQPQMLLGNIETVLSEPHKVILSETTAAKFFGDNNPVGKTIEIVHQFAYKPQQFEITGVFRNFPENTHFKIEILTSISKPDTYNSTAWVYIKLPSATDPSNMENQIRELIELNNEENYARGIIPHLTPLTDIHLKSFLARELDQNVHMQTVLILFIAGMLVFILAWFNFTLLTFSQNQLNIKRLIIHWQLGAGKKIFFYQFFVEFLTIGLISFLLAVILSILVNDPVSKNFDVSITQNWEMLILSLVLILLIMIVSAIITALIATRRLYRIVKLKYFSSQGSSGNPANAGNWFIRSVIIVEFIITFILISNLLMIREQISYSMIRQIGSTDSLTVQIPDLPRPVIDNYALFRDELKKYPVIGEVTAMMEPPGGMAMDAFSFTIEGLPVTEDRLFVFPVDENFVRFYDLKILSGNDFPSIYNTDDTTEYFMLNETAARLFDIENYSDLTGRELNMNFAIEGFIYPGQIIGVVEDFHISNMEREIEPMVIFPEYTWLYCFSIKFNGNAEQGIRVLRTEWNKIFPDYPFRYLYTTDIYKKLYATELTELRVLIIFSLLSILIAGTGLFALSGFFIQQKMHSAAIRKINGATTHHIMFPELMQYLVLALISAIIAIPASWFTMNKWQENFVYKTSIPLWIFPAIALFLILFSWIAVFYHAIRLSRLNPLEFIRGK